MLITNALPVASLTTGWQTTSPTTKAPVAPSQEPAASAPVQGSAGASEATTIAASYSTTVDGKSYSGSVEESGGTYTASVGIPPEAIASGSSLQAAEANLSVKIDALA